MTDGVLAAVDLGASSGRVMVGRVGSDTLRLDEVHRFPNGPITAADGLHWDIDGLVGSIVEGLGRAAASAGHLDGVAVDAWGVDYGLLDARGELIEAPFHYRDPRTEPLVALVDASVSRQRRYARTGTQHMAINTIFQLAADRQAGRLARARSLLLMPDLMTYRLSDVAATEATNASTTGLYDIVAGGWAMDIVDALDLPPGLFGTPRQPGERLGSLRPDVAVACGLDASTAVTLVGSHDTASAVVGVPGATDGRFAYIACGTWSLVGVELERPVVTEESRAANFTNELGVDGRIRYLRNVMGLWLLQESLRTWADAGDAADLGDLLAAAAALPAGGPVIDPDLPSLLPPGDIPTRLAAACIASDQPAPPDRPALVRCIVDSLAAAYARALEDAVRLSGHEVRTIHLVGGGSRNRLLCQLTADACGRPVVAGPVEATAIGNLLVQARTLGNLRGDLAALRDLVRRTTNLERYEPRPVVATRGA